MTLKIKELPNLERPYEKLEMYGEKYLSNAELLAIIIKTGTKEETAISLAQRVLSLNEGKEGFQFLHDISIEELMKIKGIGRIKAIQLKAVCEFARRMSTPFNFAKTKIIRPKDVYQLFKDELKYEKREILKVILLNSKNVVQKIANIAIGNVSNANINMKYVFQDAIKMGMKKIILVHNHPSGDPTPSLADYIFTKKVVKASKLLDIELIDHIVIAEDKYESIFLNLRKNKEAKKKINTQEENKK